MHIGFTHAFFVLAKLLSISLVSFMLMYDYAYIPISLRVCVSSKGGLYVSAGRTLKPVMHTHVQVCMEQLSTCLLRIFLSSLLFFSFPLGNGHVILYFKEHWFIPALIVPVRERNKMREGQRKKHELFPYLCELCRLSRLVTMVMNFALTPELPLPLTLLLPEKWKMCPHRYTLEHLKPFSMLDLFLNLFTVCPHIDLQLFIHTQKYTW